MTGQLMYDYILKVFERTDMEEDVYEAITDAIMTMKMRFEFEDFKVEAYSSGITTLGVYRIALPTNFEHIIGDVMLNDDAGGSRPLIKMTKPSFDRMYPDIKESTQTRGKPVHYCIFANTIYLGPIPDSISYTYYLSYTTQVVDDVTSATTDVPFAERYRKTLRELALADLYFGLGDDASGQKWKALGDEELGLIATVESRNIAAPATTAYTDI